MSGHEREKRHYPVLNNQRSRTEYQSQSRRYIPHGHGEEADFRPHNEYTNPKYTDYGLDWKSQLRYIPSPHNPDYITEIWPDEWKGIRPFPWMSKRTDKEWSLYPEGYDTTLRSVFDGIHKATANSSKEISHTMLFGRGRFVVDKRNGIGLAAPGDKNYQVVEYSPSFHRLGSTRPVVNFGGNVKHLPDTFVPLVELPPIPRETYRRKEHQRKREEEVKDVMNLDGWRAATPLLPPNTIQVAKHEPQAQVAAD